MANIKMFFSEISEFRELLKQIQQDLAEIKDRQTEVIVEVEIIRKKLTFQGKKFEACAEGYKNIVVVCEELTERICDSVGVVSAL
jgi:hypothetical protein